MGPIFFGGGDFWNPACIYFIIISSIIAQLEQTRISFRAAHYDFYFVSTIFFIQLLSATSECKGKENQRG